MGLAQQGRLTHETTDQREARLDQVTFAQQRRLTHEYGGREGPFHSANHSISNLVVSNLVISNLNISDLDVLLHKFNFAFRSGGAWERGYNSIVLSTRADGSSLKS